DRSLDVGRNEGIPHRRQDGGGLLRRLGKVLALGRGEIANRHQRQDVLARTKRAAAHLRRKVAPVPPSDEGVDRGTPPRGRGRRLFAACTQRVVYRLESRADKPTGRLAQELRVGPPE